MIVKFLARLVRPVVDEIIHQHSVEADARMGEALERWRVAREERLTSKQKAYREEASQENRDVLTAEGLRTL